jgi:PST family polysaccharide transporter
MPRANPPVSPRPRTGRPALPLRRLGSFILLQLFGAIAPLLVLPFVVRLVGTSGWVSLSVGYAVGAAAAIAVYCGWPIAGPPRVAGAPPAVLRAVVQESLVMRGIVTGPVLLTSCLLTWWLSDPSHVVLAVLMALAVAVSGLGASWCFIGLGRARGVFTYDALPKLVATVAAIPCVALTRSAIWYPALLLAGTLVGVALSYVHLVGRRHEPVTPREPGLRRRLRDYAVLAMSGVVGAGYTSLAVPIVQVADAPVRAVADFAGALRLRSMGQNGVAAVTTGFQGWVAETGDDALLLARMRTALVANATLGLAGGAAFVVLAPLLDGVLFGDAVVISLPLALLNGATFTAYAVGASLSHHVLAPFGLAGAIGRTRIVASIVGVPLLWVMARAWGAEGASGGVLLCELIGLGLQVRLALRGVRERRPTPPAA